MIPTSNNTHCDMFAYTTQELEYTISALTALLPVCSMRMRHADAIEASQRDDTSR
jgi:hypothetical protein